MSRHTALNLNAFQIFNSPFQAIFMKGFCFISNNMFSVVIKYYFIPAVFRRLLNSTIPNKNLNHTYGYIFGSTFQKMQFSFLFPSSNNSQYFAHPTGIFYRFTFLRDTILGLSVLVPRTSIFRDSPYVFIIHVKLYLSLY